jgi:hypothetical protein
MLRILIENAGISAYLAGVFSILAFIALFIMFAGIGIFGPINDALSIFQMLFLIPVFVMVHKIVGDQVPVIMGVLTVAAILALLAIAAMQTLLVLRQVRFEQTLRPILLLGFALAAWWVASGVLSFAEASMPNGLAWAAIASGVSFAVIAVGYLTVGPQYPLTAIGFLVGAIATPVWSIWMGRLLTSQQVIAFAGS